MTQPRSSLAIALVNYRGLRPGIALTVAAVALLRSPRFSNATSSRNGSRRSSSR